MAAALVIPTEEQTQLRQLARATKDAKTAIRIRAILALGNGHSVKHVAELFLLDEDTVAKWRNKYRKRHSFSDWLAAAHQRYNGKLTAGQQHELEAYVESELITDAAVAVQYIQDCYGQDYTINGVTKLLHRLGFVYKQTTLIPGKLDEAKQAAFKRAYEKLKAKKLPDDEVILFGDGVHPSHNVHATKAWIKKGQEKQVPTNTGRKRLNINGVLDIVAMQAVIHYAKTLNAQTTMELFDKIQAAYPDKQKIHLIVDNATYYKNKELQAYLRKRKCRIKIHWLPPYSPNLNFIERLWHYLKKYIIGTKRRQQFKEFEADIQAFFDNFSDYEQRLRQFIGTEMHLIKVQG
ncbi:MAG TPA: IS630 family transposase [Candidatus Saccharimonadales bacterium]|jgi:transposase